MRFTISYGKGRKSARLHRVGSCDWARGLEPGDSVERREVDPAKCDHAYRRGWDDDVGGCREESPEDEASDLSSSPSSPPSERPDHSPAKGELGSNFANPGR